jgi:hypothetical protein
MPWTVSFGLLDQIWRKKSGMGCKVKTLINGVQIYTCGIFVLLCGTQGYKVKFILLQETYMAYRPYVGLCAIIVVPLNLYLKKRRWYFLWRMNNTLRYWSKGWSNLNLESRGCHGILLVQSGLYKKILYTHYPYSKITKITEKSQPPSLPYVLHINWKVLPRSMVQHGEGEEVFKRRRHCRI